MPTFDELIIMDVTRGMTDTEVIEFKLDYYIKRKSEWATFWLCFFIGGLGIHQFYLRNYPKAWLFVALSVLLLPIAALTPHYGANIVYIIIAVLRVILVLYDLFTFIKITKEANYVIAREIISNNSKRKEVPKSFLGSSKTNPVSAIQTDDQDETINLKPIKPKN